MGPDTDNSTTTASTSTSDQSARHTVAALPASRQVLVGILGVATLVGATLRLTGLDARPIHYDEGVHLLETWELLTDGSYTYTGYSHGPVLIYLSAVIFRLVGQDVTIARALVAVCSLAVFPALYLLRDDFPPIALGVAAIVFAVHPWLLYTARFYRNDAIVAAAGLLSLGLYARLARHRDVVPITGLRDGTRRTWGLTVGLGLVVAVTAAAKEVGYLIVAALLAGVLVVTHFDSRFSSRSWVTARRRYLPWPVGIAGIVTLLAGIALFSGWPTDPLRAPTYWSDGIQIWLTRGSREVYQGEVLYYVSRFANETPVVFGFALLGCLGTLRRPNTSWLRWPLLIWVGFVGLVLSFHDHQWLWLMTNVFVPVVMLAGCGVTDLAAATTEVLARVPGVAGTVKTTLTQWQRKSPSQWGLSTTSPRTDFWKRWVDIATAPTGRQVVTLAVAGLVVIPVAVGAAGGIPRGVAGVTESGERDIEAEAFTTARTAAAESGCPVALGPDLSPHPAAWYLRSTPTTTIETWNVSAVQSSRILVGEEKLQATLANVSWQGSTQTFGPDEELIVARPAECQ